MLYGVENTANRFNEGPHSITLGELRSFKKKLALPLRVNFNVFLCDVESLLVGLGLIC
jgi:hypothetical protein